jgi:hypothetical protein
VLDFPRFDPGNLESTPSGMLKGSYVFVIIGEQGQPKAIAYHVVLMILLSWIFVGICYSTYNYSLQC